MDEKITSAAYVIGLYKDIESLNDHLAGYKNVLVEIAPSEKEGINLTEQQKEQLRNDTQAIRFLLIRINIKMSSLTEKIKEFNLFTENRNADYETLINSAIPSFQVLFKYVVDMNKAFVSGISADFFSKVTQMYSDYASIDNNLSGVEDNNADNEPRLQ